MSRIGFQICALFLLISCTNGSVDWDDSSSTAEDTDDFSSYETVEQSYILGLGFSWPAGHPAADLENTAVSSVSGSGGLHLRGTRHEKNNRDKKTKINRKTTLTIAEGGLDASFGSLGRIESQLLIPRPDSSAYHGFSNVVVNDEGYIFAAGNVIADGGNRIVGVEKYLPNGTLDATFGSHGLAVLALGSVRDNVRAILLQPDGKIVIAGNTQFSLTAPIRAGGDSFVARLNADGSLDSTFATDGVFTQDFDVAYSASVLGYDTVTSLAFDSTDNSLLAAGAAYRRYGSDYPARMLFFRLTSAGELDSSLNGTGYKVQRFEYNRNTGSPNPSFGTIIKLDSQKRIVVAGAEDDNFDSTHDRAFAVARFDRNGNPDMTFGADRDGVSRE